MLYQNKMLKGSRENYADSYHDSYNKMKSEGNFSEQNRTKSKDGGYIRTLRNLNLDEAEVVSEEDFEKLVGKVFGTELNQKEMKSLIHKYSTEGGVSFQDFIRDYEKYHKVESGPFQPKMTYGPRAQSSSQKWDLRELEEKIRDRIELKNHGDGSFQFQTTRKMFANVRRNNMQTFLRTFLGFDVTAEEAEAFFQKYRKSGSSSQLDVPRLAKAMLQGPVDYPEPRRLSDAKQIYQSTTWRAHYTPVGSAQQSEQNTSEPRSNRWSPNVPEDIDSSSQDPDNAPPSDPHYLSTSRQNFAPFSERQEQELQDREVWTPSSGKNEARHRVMTGRTTPGQSRPQSAPASRQRSRSATPMSSSHGYHAGAVPNQPPPWAMNDTVKGLMKPDFSKADDVEGEAKLREAILKKGRVAGEFQFVRMYKACRAFIGAEVIRKESLLRMSQRLFQVQLTNAELDAIFDKYDVHGHGALSLPIFLGHLLRVADRPTGRWFHDKQGYILEAGRRVGTKPMLPRATVRETSRHVHWDLKKFEQCLREKVLMKTCADGAFQYRDAFKVFHPARGPMTALLSRQQFLEVLDERLEIVVDHQLLDLFWEKYDPDNTGKIAVKDLVKELIPTDWDGSNFLTPRDAEEEIAYKSLMKRVFDVTGKAHDYTGLKGVRGMSSRNLTTQDGQREEGQGIHQIMPTNPALGGTVHPSRPQSAMASSHTSSRPASAAAPKRPQTAGPARRPARPARRFSNVSKTSLASSLRSRPRSAQGYTYVDSARQAQEDRHLNEKMRGASMKQRNVQPSPIHTSGRSNQQEEYRQAPVFPSQRRRKDDNNRPETDSIKTEETQTGRQKYILKAQHILHAIEAAEEKQRRAATQQHVRSKVRVKGQNKSKKGTGQNYLRGTKTSQIRKDKTMGVGKASFTSRYKKDSRAIMNKNELKRVLYDSYGQNYTADIL
mmetsp:Transcript_33601/g.42894  ORF Transcript_33601/g.42894 Transcript_33601/m.42894 type:complete len:943 (-) Transcript_33601:191-3019(-)